MHRYISSLLLIFRYANIWEMGQLSKSLDSLDSLGIRRGVGVGITTQIPQIPRFLGNWGEKGGDVSVRPHYPKFCPVWHIYPHSRHLELPYGMDGLNSLYIERGVFLCRYNFQGGGGKAYFVMTPIWSEVGVCVCVFVCMCGEGGGGISSFVLVSIKLLVMLWCSCLSW